ncbi:MAG: hypothetical protein ACI8TQ_003599 [Planctomycetota bacterium]
MITADSDLVEVAFAVCTALDRAGVTAVLSGGGAATFYAPEAIQSYDLDFILEVYPKDGDPAQVLTDLGYRNKGHDYVHSVSRFQLEFPRGPLAVGDDLIRKWSTQHSGDELLHIITATDSCRDRLAAFYHFKDRSALEQALAVSRTTKATIDLKQIKSWSRREGMLDEYATFERLLD